jgi:uncharacterized protein (DUF983 family)
VGKPGIITMFVGAVLLTLLLLLNLNISFSTWLVLFLIAALIAAVGTIMSIVELAKKIKEEADQKRL